MSEKGKTRLGNCEVCDDSASKYTCPKCEVKTCSLNCHQIHKFELKCDAKQDNLKYIPISKMSNRQLEEDGQFLENINAIISQKKINKLPSASAKNKDLRKHLKFKYSIDYKYLPTPFSKAKENTTQYNKQQGVVFWHLHLIFVHASNLKIPIDNCSGDSKLNLILEPYFDAKTFHDQRLVSYQSEGLPAFVALLKAEEQPGSKYYKLDLSQSLLDNLRGKTIIEFPVISIVSKEHEKSMAIVEDNTNKTTIASCNYFMRTWNELSSASSSSSSDDDDGNDNDTNN